MKKLILLLATLMSISFILSACSGKAAGGNEEKTIKVANYFGKDHPQNIALKEKFKKIVEEESGGKLKVKIYPNSQLGAEKEFYDGIRNGTIEMGVPGTIMQADVEKIGILDLPFIFEDFTHFKKVLNGPVGKEIIKDLESTHNVKVLAWSGNGVRMISSNKLIDSMEDFDGFRIRMPNIPSYVRVGELLGASVNPLPFSEVFTALEQGVVDGQDNPIATLRYNGWYEVQSHLLESRHIFNPNMYTVNKDFWNNLSGEQQKLLQKAADETAKYEWELLESSYKENKKFLEEHGVTFTEPDEEFKQALREAVQPLIDDYKKKYEWTERFLKEIEAAK